MKTIKTYIIETLKWLANQFVKGFERFSEFVMALKRDKWKHLIAGLLIFGIVICLAGLFTDNVNLIYSIAYFSIVLAGFLKELWDIKHGTPELADFLFTISIPSIVMAGQFGWPLIKIIGKLI